MAPKAGPKRHGSKQHTSLRNGCRIPEELMEGFLIIALSQEIHRILSTCSTVSIHVEQVRRRCNSWEADADTAEYVLASARSSAFTEMKLETILTLLHVSRQFRAIIQKHLCRLCPVEFQDPYTKKLLPNARNGFLLEPARNRLYADTHPLLRSLWAFVVWRVPVSKSVQLDTTLGMVDSNQWLS